MFDRKEMLPLLIVLAAIIVGLVVKEVKLHHHRIAGQGLNAVSAAATTE